MRDRLWILKSASSYPTKMNQTPSDSLSSTTNPGNLPPEFDLGNVEYKLILPSSISRCRFEHLVTQMKWRLMEGLGEAVYEIGVADDGQLKGLASDDLNASLTTLRRMANHVGASMTIIRRRTLPVHVADSVSLSAAAVKSVVGSAREICEVLVRRIPADDQGFIDIRVSLLGDADAGKSTLLGVLSSGERDNGKGRARLNLFRHPHEILTGRTSSVSNEIIGFDDRGRLVNYAKNRTAEEICARSTKLLTLTDLCGHKRYLRTTVSGLVGHKPDFIMIVINSVRFADVYAGSQQLALARAVGAPVFIVLTKIDLLMPLSSQAHAADEVQTSIRRLVESAIGGRRVPLIIESEDDAVSAAVNMQSESIVPVFRVSCKTGENMDLLVKFLNMLPPGRTLREKERLLQVPTVFAVMQWYRLPLPVGIVLAGFVEAGIIRPNDRLLLGPDRRGHFTPVRVTSIHRYKSACRMAKAGEAASVAVDGLPLDCALRKGLFLVHDEVLKGDEGEASANCPSPAGVPLSVVVSGEVSPAVIGKCCHSLRAEVQFYRVSCQLPTYNEERDVRASPAASSSGRQTDLPRAKTDPALCSTRRTVNVGTHLSLHVGNVVQTVVVVEVVGAMKRVSSELSTPTEPADCSNADAVEAEHSAVAVRVAKRHAHSRIDRQRKTQSWVDERSCERPSLSPMIFDELRCSARPQSSACVIESATTATAETSVIDTDEKQSCVFTAEFASDIDSATTSRDALPTNGKSDNGNSQQSRHLHSHAEELLIVFEFLQRPEFVLLNSKLILRQNRETIGVGKVVSFVDVVEPVIVTKLWPSGAKLSEAAGDAAQNGGESSPCNIFVRNTSGMHSTVSATPPMTETVAPPGELLSPPRELRCLVQSNAANCSIEQQIRRTTQDGSSSASMLFNNDLVGFDSHSPLTQLSYLDDDDD